MNKALSIASKKAWASRRRRSVTTGLPLARKRKVVLVPKGGVSASKSVARHAKP